MHIPPCPRCGYPELKTREEYLKVMGCTARPKVLMSVQNKPLEISGANPPDGPGTSPEKRAAVGPVLAQDGGNLQGVRASRTQVPL